jgi:peptidyl-tRNA hydrolase, PTH1 family
MAIRLIVGLGNPGKEYEGTRHNAGYRLVERFADAQRIALRKEAKYHGIAGRDESTGAWLLMPTTFMNLSGKSVGALAGFFKIVPAEILVAHDELDFLPGVVKMKLGGGVGGHNGLKDVAAHLGSNDFWRFRFGIGHPGDKDMVSDYVLGKPSKLDREAIEETIDRALEILPLAVAGEVERAMHKLHTKPKPPKEPPVKESP